MKHVLAITFFTVLKDILKHAQTRVYLMLAPDDTLAREPIFIYFHVPFTYFFLFHPFLGHIPLFYSILILSLSLFLSISSPLKTKVALLFFCSLSKSTSSKLVEFGRCQCLSVFIIRCSSLLFLFKLISFVTLHQHLPVPELPYASQCALFCDNFVLFSFLLNQAGLKALFI